MSKSVAKRYANERNVCLPFAQPMKKTDGPSVVWPFTRQGFALFYGTVNFADKCVTIGDQTAVIALQNMGFFGIDGGQPFRDFKPDKTSTDGKAKQRTPSKYLNGKYVLTSTSLEEALSDQLFCDNQCSDKCETTPLTGDQDMGTTNLSTQSTLTPVIKPLKLSFMESFFMSYIFGSLNVLNTENNNYMTIDDMWSAFGHHFSQNSLDFAVHYSAYHYFRSKGWVVRNGSTFGAHFLLYKEGPHLYHSLHSVIIQHSIDGQCKQSFDWFYMSALVRLQRNVRKELIVCLVNVPKDCDISHPNCIKEFEIDLLSVNRFNALKGINNLDDD